MQLLRKAGESGLSLIHIFGNIICCCNENGNLWNLIHHGQFRTDTVSVPTGTPEADVTLPAGLERLIYACGGLAEVDIYLDACRRGGMYCPRDSVLSRLGEGLDVSVVSSRRMISTISGIRGSAGYLLSPYAALAYAGQMCIRDSLSGGTSSSSARNPSTTASPLSSGSLQMCIRDS